MKKPIFLMILDGFGENKDDYGNAIKSAHTPNIDDVLKNYPHTYINASGMAVGLPEGQMGNSEVGHTNIGAGRIVYQELTRITKSIADGDFFENVVLNEACDNAVKNGSSLHIMGLLSDGGVHSHNTHIYGLLELAKKKGVSNVFLHCFMDGRDVPPKSGADFIKELEAKTAEIGIGKIATVSGRYYAMDRDNRWERVEKAYNAMVYGQAEVIENSFDGMQKSYASDVTDEFVVPFITMKEGRIKSGDSVVFANFRPDRARQITRTLVDDNFDGFDRGASRPQNLTFVCMTQYDKTMPNCKVAFLPQTLNNTFGEYISKLGLRQLRIAETEKYAHVTFFYNGGVEKVYEGEDRILVPSPKVATYDLKPEMSAIEVTEKVCDALDSDHYDVIILNYANCDMVGHTGIFDAAKVAVETVDSCVGKVRDKILEKGGVLIITADHGNADKMYEADGSPFTAHTTNPVLFAVVGEKCSLKEGGKLADISPTMLDIMGIEKPAEMTGESLILK
ncbi:MAG: 2,3-bisphosphoglycerate-independent phosphoglycerate mutase [Oscillospiraceae bacterium]|nr:2,3-bisphosphoglycerate-independent phosphoglycerate mutase [Oscillospiraceae bacterium]